MAVLATVVVMMGCASRATLVEPGMSKESLAQRLGEPDRRRERSNGGEVWSYRGSLIHDPPERRDTAQGRTLELHLEGDGGKAYLLFLDATFDEEGRLRAYRYSARPAYGYRGSGEE